MRTDLALAALASAAVPGMKPVTVAGIGLSDEGRASELQSALVEDATGRRWVVRAPLTPVAGARLQRNDELVRQLSRHVPFKVPAAVGYAPVGKDGSAAVYPFVEGSPLDLRRLPAGPGLASAVGRALAAVHNIPRAVFEEQDVPVFDASGTRQRAIADVDRAAETGRVPTGLLARWEEAFEAAPLWQFATTPVHGAFTGDSVVVAFTDEDDASTGRVVAVQDWDEAMVGDPAVDLAELWSQSSRQAWDEVLDSYTLARAHRPDPYLHARARLVAELRTLRGLAHAVAEGDEETARRVVEALRRTDRLTEADDSLVPVTARPSGARATGPAGAEPPVGPAGATEYRSARPVVESSGDLSSPDEAPDDPHPTDSLGADVDGPDHVTAPDPASARGPSHEADPTMEVPAPSPVDVDRSGTSPTGQSVDGTGAADREPPEDPALPEHSGQDAEDLADEDATVQMDPVALGPTGRSFERPSSDVEAAGVDVEATAVEEVPASAVPATDDASGTGADADVAAPEPGGTDDLVDGDGDDELRDEERLQELYGMPAPDRDVERR